MSQNKFLYFFILSVACCGLNYRGLCQTNAIPVPVTSHFASMFPEAKNIEWRDKLTNFQVFFLAGQAKCEAKFNSDGTWISTEKQMNKDSIPEKIKGSLHLSKYADWNIKSAYILHFSDQPVQYHIVVTKDNSPNKILFFDETGQMLKDNPSL
jgi:hypothetical protein